MLLLAAVNFCNMITASLNFMNQAGGKNTVTVSILEKDKLSRLAQSIQERVFADMDGLRHQESMNLGQQQFSVQAQQALLQQQMLEAQKAAAHQGNDSHAPTSPQ